MFPSRFCQGTWSSEPGMETSLKLSLGKCRRDAAQDQLDTAPNLWYYPNAELQCLDVQTSSNMRIKRGTDHSRSHAATCDQGKAV